MSSLNDTVNASDVATDHISTRQAAMTELKTICDELQLILGSGKNASTKLKERHDELIRRFRDINTTQLSSEDRFADGTPLLTKLLSGMSTVPATSWRKWMDEDTKVELFRDAISNAHRLSLFSRGVSARLPPRKMREMNKIYESFATLSTGKSQESQEACKEQIAGLEGKYAQLEEEAWSPVHEWLDVALTYSTSMDRSFPVDLSGKQTNERVKKMVQVYDAFEEVSALVKGKSEQSIVIVARHFTTRADRTSLKGGFELSCWSPISSAYIAALTSIKEWLNAQESEKVSFDAQSTEGLSDRERSKLLDSRCLEAEHRAQLKKMETEKEVGSATATVK